MPRHVNKTSFKKGHTPSNGFKKGMIPWNKGLKQWNGKLPLWIKKKISRKLKGRKLPWLNKYYKKGKNMANYTTIFCKICKKSFLAKKWNIIHSNKRYCSLKCRCLDAELYKQSSLKTRIKNEKNGIYEWHRQRMLNGGAIKARLAARMARPSKKQRNLYEKVKEYFPTAILEYPLQTENTVRFLDIAIPDRQFCIEFNGTYWHKNREVFDAIRQKEIENCGWKVINVYEESEVYGSICKMG